MSVLPLQQDIYYPESDGQPVGETWFHAREYREILNALDLYFLDDPDVWVGGNQFLYYVEGDPRRVVCPDVAVTKGMSKEPGRRIYKLWTEGRPPSLIIELTSDSTRQEDLGKKKDLYERLGVEDYFLFDLLGDFLNPNLQGYRLVAGRYRPIEPDADGELPSRATGLKLKAEGDRLRVLDAATGEPLLWNHELGKAAEEARANARRAEQAEERARAAEAELARLRSELERR
jgi:Uma2 family endonuclease